MFRLSAEKNKLALLEREAVTSGSVNVYKARFEFSEDWAELDRVAVFQSGGTAREVLLDAGGECVVPWEVLRVPGLRLRAGVYGKRGGEVVLPTVWANLGIILEGVPAGGSPPPYAGPVGAGAGPEGGQSGPGRDFPPSPVREKGLVRSRNPGRRERRTFVEGRSRAKGGEWGTGGGRGG